MKSFFPRRAATTTQPRKGRGRRVNPFRPALEVLEDRRLLSGSSTLAPTPTPAATTNVVVLATPKPSTASPSVTAPPGALTPAQVNQAYAFNQVTFSNGTVKGDGTGQTIAIVDAYNQPNIASDLANFDTAFSLPAANLTVVGENGGAVPTGTNTTWGEETSLDVEWAHAIAPGANILLVEATSNSWTDLWAGVNYARNQPGVAAVSMSWGAPEWSGDTSNDSYFTTPSGHTGVTFLAATGDSGSGTPNYPAVSANVVAVGGTQISIDGSGNYLSETAWSGSVGGISSYESQPGYQKGVVTQTSTQRAIPDVSYNSSTGYDVYDTDGTGGWVVLAGTSAASPQWAALLAIADQGRVLAGKTALDGATQTLPALYGLSASDFHDITTGSNGAYSAGPGYDLVTGRGTPIANLVVADLVNYGSGQPPGGPTITAGASASPSPVTGKTTNLSVQASENGSSSGLTYTWSVTAEPAGAANPTFSVNGTSSANNTTATFYKAGNYTFQVTVTDTSGLSATSTASVVVNQTKTGVGVTPSTTSVANGGSQQFAATDMDQFGNAMASQPGSWTWKLVSGSGTVGTGGMYTAPGSGTGSASVQAADGSTTGTANVSYGSAPAAPSNLTASAPSAHQVNLAWTNNSTNATGTVIQRSRNGSNWTQVATVGAGVATYTDNSVSRRTTYYYRVYAYNGVGNSGYSNVVTVVTPHVVAVGQQTGTGTTTNAATVTTAATPAPVANTPAPVTTTPPAVATAPPNTVTTTAPQNPPAANHPAANAGMDLWGSLVWQLFLEDSTLISMLLKVGSVI
jgi:subtilase family serine protease